MAILGPILWTVIELVVLYELFVYGIRRYEMLNAGESPGRHGFANAVGAFLAECAARSLFVFTMPLGFFWPYAKPSFGTPRPVILLHGYASSRWSLAILAWRLRRDGFGPVYGVGYRSLFGGVAEAILKFRAELDRAAAEGHAVVDVVGHSLGGLVVRKALRDPELAGRVRKLVTIGTPHGGSKLAALAWDPLGQELHPESDFIHGLSEGDPVPAGTEATSIFSTFDALVLPPRNAFLPGAANVEVKGIGHNAMLLSPKVYALVKEALEAPTSTSPPLPLGERSAQSAR